MRHNLRRLWRRLRYLEFYLSECVAASTAGDDTTRIQAAIDRVAAYNPKDYSKAVMRYECSRFKWLRRKPIQITDEGES